jgi:hypothetical protein
MAAAAAEGHFRQALDRARRQGALSWELRAATSLARLLFQKLETDMVQVVGLIDPPPLTVPLEIDPREGQCRTVRKAVH